LLHYFVFVTSPPVPLRGILHPTHPAALLPNRLPQRQRGPGHRLPLTRPPPPPHRPSTRQREISPSPPRDSPTLLHLFRRSLRRRGVGGPSYQCRVSGPLRISCNVHDVQSRRFVHSDVGSGETQWGSCWCDGRERESGDRLCRECATPRFSQDKFCHRQEKDGIPGGTRPAWRSS
jgi:hypothetical protein